MGKINKYANIYDKEGNLIRHVGDDGKLKKYTINELEDLVDKLAEDKDENGNVKDPQSLNNVYSVLSEQYKKNPKYLFNKINELQKKNESEGATMAEKTSAEDIERALNDTVDDGIIEPDNEEVHLRSTSTDSEQLIERETDYEPDTYVQFEEITDSDESSKEVIPEVKEAA